MRTKVGTGSLSQQLHEGRAMCDCAGWENSCRCCKWNTPCYILGIAKVPGKASLQQRGYSNWIESMVGFMLFSNYFSRQIFSIIPGTQKLMLHVFTSPIATCSYGLSFPPLSCSCVNAFYSVFCFLLHHLLPPVYLLTFHEQKLRENSQTLKSSMTTTSQD